MSGLPGPAFSSGPIGDAHRQRLEQAVRHLCSGADVVCEAIASGGMVPRLNAMTGGYSWDDAYVWNIWADFQWAPHYDYDDPDRAPLDAVVADFLTGRRRAARRLGPHAARRARQAPPRPVPARGVSHAQESKAIAILPQ